jgi:K+-transporting ATPase KdpF subunit
MTALYLVYGSIASAIFIYLLVVLFKPERF